MAPESFNMLSVDTGDLGDHFGALSVPIHKSIFAFPGANEAAAIQNELKPGYCCGRIGNPTTATLERVVAELERCGVSRRAFSSGMSAVTAAGIEDIDDLRDDFERALVKV